METLLALEMIRVTEAAAVASARLMGRGAHDEADLAATEAMRQTLDDVPMRGTIVIGEGERDEAPDALDRRAGRAASAPRMSRSTSRSIRSRAPTSSPAASPTPSPCSRRRRRAASCMRPIRTSRSSASGPSWLATSISASRPARTCGPSPLRWVAPRATSPSSSSSASATPRSSMRSARRARASSSSATATSLAAISCAVQGTGVHAVMGIGGAPEGVLTAAALRCLGGEIQARFRFRSDAERAARRADGHRPGRGACLRDRRPRTWEASSSGRPA